MDTYRSMIDNPYNDYRTYEDIIKKKMVNNFIHKIEAYLNI